MIWSDKTKEAVESAISNPYPIVDFCATKAALAAVAESDEWKAKDQEIERLKQQVSVLRTVALKHLDAEHPDFDADYDKIGEEV